MAALLSAVTGRSLKSGFAMTGEITLTGRLLPIGGVKEKVLAAHRYKMTQVLLPKQNEKDLEEIPKEVVQELSFVFADSVLDALAILFPEGSFQKEPVEVPVGEVMETEAGPRTDVVPPADTVQANFPPG
jgi:ATP-dependent Lon protease